MRTRRSQRAVRQQTMLFAGGVLLVAIGTVLMAQALFGSGGTPTAGDAAPTPVSVAGITAGLAETTTTAPTTVPTTTLPPPPRAFTLAATGDLLAQQAVNARAAELGAFWGADYDFRPMFEQVRPLIEGADLALCHLETPLARPGGEVLAGTRFSAPHELAVAIEEAGYDGCSTASDHALDMGAEGVAATLDELDFRGIGHAGTARTFEEAATITRYDVAGVPVAHLAYSFGSIRPLEAPYLLKLIDPDVIAADARHARAGGAQVVIDSLHWGEHFTRNPTRAQQELAAALSQVPEVDLVIGHHAHVVQPVARVGDLPVAYGLGNFLSDQHASACCPAASQDGVILHVRFEETGSATNEFVVSAITYTATSVDRDTHTITLAEGASRARTAAALGPDVTPHEL